MRVARRRIPSKANTSRFGDTTSRVLRSPTCSPARGSWWRRAPRSSPSGTMPGTGVSPSRPRRQRRLDLQRLGPRHWAMRGGHACRRRGCVGRPHATVRSASPPEHGCGSADGSGDYRAGLDHSSPGGGAWLHHVATRAWPTYRDPDSSLSFRVEPPSAYLSLQPRRRRREATLSIGCRSSSSDAGCVGRVGAGGGT